MKDDGQGMVDIGGRGFIEGQYKAQMVCRFDLKAGVEAGQVQIALESFARDMSARGLIAAAGPLCRRYADTPMDTDPATIRAYSAVFFFEDRNQLNEAYDVLKTMLGPVDERHHGVLTLIENPIFTCFEEID
ncbi:MAG: hypothetical protein AAGE61_11675 [Pseudomonadota bacterium]